MVKVTTAGIFDLILRYPFLLFIFCQIKNRNKIKQLNATVCVIMQIMDEMFGHKPWMNPILTLDSKNNIPSSSSFVSNSSDNTSLSSELPHLHLVAVKDLKSVNENYYIQEILQMYFIIFHIIDFSLSYSDSGQKVNETVALEELVAIVQENKKEKRNMYKETATRQQRLLHILENIANKM